MFLFLVLPCLAAGTDVWHYGLSKPSQPLAYAGPLVKPDGGYQVTQDRANAGQPFIDAENHPEQSVFHFNLVPAHLRLPNGAEALLVRSVNGSSYQKDNGTASTLLNPDVITLTRLTSNLSNVDSIKVESIRRQSIVLSPEPGNKKEACGVQDPRVIFDQRSGTYIMTYAAYGDPLPKDPKTNPNGTWCGSAGLGLVTTKTPEDASSWKRPANWSYDCNGACGKSAAILVRDQAPHFMFWGIPTISVAISDDLINWQTYRTDWVTPQAAWNEMWIEAGSPPQRLSDGNYLMTYNIADTRLWWGIGYLILDRDDPTNVIQRGSHLIWPSLPWEFANSSTSKWEPYKDCIGAMNSLQRLPGEEDRFLGYYVAGDAVSGAAVITVKKQAHSGQSPAKTFNDVVVSV